MDKQSAVRLFDQYMQRSDALDLDDRLQQVIIRKLQWLNSADINDVVRVVEETEENQKMYRGNSPQQSQSTQQQQSPQEQKQILAQFLEKDYAAKVAPNAVQLVDQNGKIVSKINFNAFAAAVKSETTYGTGKHPVRHDILSEIVLRLDQAGLLEHHPQVVERIVEVEKTVLPTRREEQKHNFNRDQQMNRAESPIKGIGEQAPKKPVVSEAELAAQARHDLNENAVMADVRRVIAMHSHSGSHAAKPQPIKFRQVASVACRIVISEIRRRAWK